MRSESVQQFAIVREDSAAAFEEVLNARIKDLSGKSPTVRFDGLTAYISYTETNRIAETIADQFELNGACFHCEDCPCFQPILKSDGTVDGRVKYGDCEFAEYGRTYKDSKACDHLYKMLKNGRIGLCWKE